MKKLFLLFIFCSFALKTFAFSAGNLFIQNSCFWQNKFSLDLLGQGEVSAGLTFDLTEHKDIKDHIYAFHIPFMLNFSMLDLTVNPFWYPESNNAEAYGGSIKLQGLIRNDEINSTYVNGYFKTAFANQNTNIIRGTSPQTKEKFKQFAFEGGLDFNLANLYIFNINGNVFTYPNKVKDISFFGGIMNQNDLADLGTIDYVLNLPEFSVGGIITWISNENNTRTSFSYKYINYENNLINHSLMFRTLIPVSKNLIATLIYNHIFEMHHKNKDLFAVGLNYLF